MSVVRPDAVRCNLFYRRGLDINQRHIVAVERAEIVAVDRRPLGAKGKALGRQKRPRCGIIDLFGDLGPNERSGRLVG